MPKREDLGVARGRNDLGFIEIEVLLGSVPGWNALIEVDDSNDEAEIVSLCIRSEGHPGARAGQTLEQFRPPRPLTTSVLRAVRVADLLRIARQHAQFERPSRLLNPNRQASGTPTYFAAWAAQYVEALRGGSRSPVNDLAQRFHRDRDQVRDIIHACRGQGFLTSGRPGVGGGQLTQKALEVLAEN